MIAESLIGGWVVLVRGVNDGEGKVSNGKKISNR